MKMREFDIIFGKIVRYKRKQMKISQEKLSELAGISTVHCRNIELGKHRTSWVTWVKLCTVLEIDMNSLADKYIKPILNDVGENIGMKF